MQTEKNYCCINENILYTHLLPFVDEECVVETVPLVCLTEDVDEVEPLDMFDFGA